MSRQKVSVTILFLSLILITSCIFLISPGPRMTYTFRFSIKNNSSSDIDVTLLVGKVPNVQARFDEFELIPDEIYTLMNEHWDPELHAHVVVKPNAYNKVVNFLPVAEIGPSLDAIPIEYQEKHQILYESLSEQLISFVLTISRNDIIIYRIVGWDIPDEDMAKYQINDELLGYYNTSPESYIDSRENIQVYPLFFSKLIEGEPGTYFGGEFTFYIKATSNDAHVQEFNPYSTWVDEDDYWKK
jgi:hypothetical protein